MDKHFYLTSDPKSLFAKVDSFGLDTFSKLSQLAEKRYSVPKDVFLRQCKRILIIYHHKYLKIKKTFGVFSLVYFRVYYWLLLVSLLLLPKHKNGPKKSDITFELWCTDGMDNYRFYDKIYKNLKDKFSILFAVFNIKQNQLRKGLFTYNLIFSDVKIDSDAAKDVFKKETWFLPANNGDVDSYFIWSRFLRHYLVSRTRCENINTKVYITAGDNYLSPLRYWLMKQSGIQLIVLLQNGFRTNCIESGGAYYNETDLYEVFGNKQRELLKKQGCMAKTWLPMGSIPAINKMAGLTIKSDGPITVIGHDFSYRIGHYNVDDFNFMLSHIREFSIRNRRHIKYIARAGSNAEKKNYERFMKSEWTEFDNKTDCYDAVAHASVCINYLSSLGTEAIGMGKRVLTFNWYNDDMVVNNNDEHGVVLSRSYEEFEKKLLRLVDDKSFDIDEYYSRVREERMQLNAKVYSIIVNHCTETLVQL